VTLESNRMLGGVGALLIVVGAVFSLFSLAAYVFPPVSVVFAGVAVVLGVLSFVGFIMFMIALNGLASYYGDRGIFDNALYGVLVVIVGCVVAAMVAVAIVAFSAIGSGWRIMAAPSLAELAPFMFGPVVGVYVVTGVFGFVYAWFFRRAFNRLAAKSQVDLFRTGGLLFMVGVLVSLAVMIICALLVYAMVISFTGIFAVGAVGSVVSCAAWAVVTAAFFRIKVPASQTPQTSTPATGQVKFCSRCEVANSDGTMFCVGCGEKQQP